MSTKEEGNRYPSRDLLLEELRLEYMRELEIKKILEGKANAIITTCGIMTPLVFGFTVLLLTNEFFQTLQSSNILQIPLSISIFFILFSLIFSIRALKLHEFMVPLGHELFFNKKERNIEEINNYQKAHPITFKSNMITQYLESIKHNSDENQARAFKIKLASWTFIFGIGFFILSILLVLKLI